MPVERRRAHLQPRPGALAGGAHPAHAGHRRRSTSTASRRTWTPIRELARRPRPARCSRTPRRRTARATGAGASARSGTLRRSASIPTKNLGALGDGGAVTHRRRRARRRGCGGCATTGPAPTLRARDRGQYNSRLDELQAALLRRQAAAARRVERRRRRVRRRATWTSSPHRSGCRCRTRPRAPSRWHLFVVRHPERDRLQQRADGGTASETLIHYPIPPHRTPRLPRRARGLRLPVTERLAARSLSLPLAPAIWRSRRAGASTDALSRLDEGWRLRDGATGRRALHRARLRGLSALASDESLSRTRRWASPTPTARARRRTSSRHRGQAAGARGARADGARHRRRLQRRAADASMALCGERGHRLVLVDSAEMLGAAARRRPARTSVPAASPTSASTCSSEPRGASTPCSPTACCTTCSSSATCSTFLDRALELLAPGGRAAGRRRPQPVQAQALLLRPRPACAFHQRVHRHRRAADGRAPCERGRHSTTPWCSACWCGRARPASTPTLVPQPAGCRWPTGARTSARLTGHEDRAAGDKLVIVGDSAFAEVAYEYFTHDSPYEVVALRRRARVPRRDELFGLPVVPFEDARGALRTRPSTRSTPPLRLHPGQRAAARGSYEAAKAKGYRAGVLRQPARLRLAQRRARRALLHLREQRRAAVRHASAATSCCGAATTSATTRRSATTASSRRTSWSRASSRSARTASSASTRRWSNNITIGRDTWIGPQVTITRDVESGSVFRPARSELRDESSLELFGVARLRQEH